MTYETVLDFSKVNDMIINLKGLVAMSDVTNSERQEINEHLEKVGEI